MIVEAPRASDIRARLSGGRAPERLRVAYFVTKMDVGGTEMNALRTAERLDRSRFDLVVCWTGAKGPLLQRYIDAGIRAVHFPLTSLYNRSALVQGRRLYRFLRDERIDVVHAHDLYSNVFAIPWARLAGVPLTIASRRWTHPADNRRLEIANRLAYRLAHRVLGNSTAVARELEQGDGVRSRRILCVPNFVEEYSFERASPAMVRRFFNELGIPDGALVVGCVARLVPVKDHGSLIRAVALLAAQWPALHLVLVGDGPCRADLETLASELGISQRVHFAGYRPNHPNLNSTFDICALASTSEGFPNSLVEGLAAGRPLVATDVGGNADAVRDGTGLLVPASAPALLARAIERFLENPDMRASMGVNAERVARLDYHADAVIPRLEQIYFDLVRRTANGARR